jgi:TolA-binding protein
MKNHLNIISLTLILFFFSCKTQEQIRRTQMVDNMALQMVQNQKLSANTTVRIQDLEQKILEITGSFEEKDHNKDIIIKKDLEELKKKIAIFQELDQNNQSQIDNLSNDVEIIKIKLEENKKFMTKVLEALDKLSKVPAPKKKSRYSQAIKFYRSGRYKLARPILEGLLKSKKVRGNRKARVYHNLGMIAYMDKRFQEATILFSKLFTKYPKAPYIPNGMLFLGKSFLKLKQKGNAQGIFKELIKRYPKHKRAKQAKGYL